MSGCRAGQRKRGSVATIEPKLVVATPVRAAELGAADVKFGWAEAMRQLSNMMPTVAFSAYCTDVVRGRNRIAAKVLRDAPTATHVLHWDDDCWPENVGIVPEMMALGVDVVGACYTNKAQPLHWVHWKGDQGDDVDDRGLLRVRGLGFGFTLTTTKCLRRMSATARQYTDYPSRTRTADIFGMLYDKGEDPDDETSDSLLSEDFSFCKRWGDLGEPLYVWNRAIITHAGPHGWGPREMFGAMLR